MTENLLLNIYSSLDPHKKGYLTFTDWEIAFSNFNFWEFSKGIFLGSYNWNKQLLVELQNGIYTNFSSIESAFDFFVKKSPEYFGDESPKEISLNAFKECLESLLPRRFSDFEMNFLWEKITYKNSKMSKSEFAGFLNANKFTKEDLKTL